MAGYILQWGAGIGAGILAAPAAGPLAAYAAGAGAFSGLGIALDSAIHEDIKAGDWSGALDHSSYHLPLLGAGRDSWDAWNAGHPWHAAGHAGLGSLEAFGLRGAWLRGAPRGLGAGGAGKVWWGGKGVQGGPRVIKKVTVSIEAANGIKVKGLVKHSVHRAIGDFERSGVKVNSILDALKKPLKISGIKIDSMGRKSQRFIGKTGEVVINPDTGLIISINVTKSRKAAGLMSKSQPNGA